MTIVGLMGVCDATSRPLPTPPQGPTRPTAVVPGYRMRPLPQPPQSQRTGAALYLEKKSLSPLLSALALRTFSDAPGLSILKTPKRALPPVQIQGNETVLLATEINS